MHPYKITFWSLWSTWSSNLILLFSFRFGAKTHSSFWSWSGKSMILQRSRIQSNSWDLIIWSDLCDLSDRGPSGRASAPIPQRSSSQGKLTKLSFHWDVKHLWPAEASAKLSAAAAPLPVWADVSSMNEPVSSYYCLLCAVPSGDLTLLCGRPPAAFRAEMHQRRMFAWSR